MRRQPAPEYDGPTVPGIDVSRWQGEIDWPRVAASDVRWVAVRTGDGMDTDSLAVRHITGAHAAGLLVAAYHYLRARHGAEVNLGVIHEVLRVAGVPIGFVAIDVEGGPPAGGAWLGDVPTERVLEVLDVLGTALEADGHRVLIYSGQSWHWHVAAHGLGAEIAARWPLWAPWYSEHDRPSVPVYADGTPVWPEWRIWQWSGSGSVPGIDSHAVDLDRWRGSEGELAVWWDPATRSTAPPRPFDRAEVLALAERAKAAGDLATAERLLAAAEGLAAKT